MSRFKHWQFDKTRIEAYSDAVFAIILTILVLELKIPHTEGHLSETELYAKLYHLLPTLVSWVISFLVVSTFWLHHHNLLRMASKADYAMIWINNIFLLFMSLIPFPAALMGSYPHLPFAVASFGMVMLFSSLLLNLFYHYITTHYLSHRYDKAAVQRNVRRSFWIGPLLFGVATLSAWIHPYLALCLYAIVPILFVLPLDRPIATDADEAE
ncbi:MAG: DUF1211 domain-containing protein [Chitinophagales bacterium]|nr:DUF1211 domain-containing protein [Chitinophagales bacterium]